MFCTVRKRKPSFLRCWLHEEVDYPQLQTRCREYLEIRRQVEHDLKEQVRNALIRQRLNFRHIVPTYYPTTEEIGFLIPLRMCGENVPDTALVVTVDQQGNRRREVCTKFGRTLLTMDMAYNNSRLLCKPESEWLNPSDIIKPSEEDLLDVFEVELRIDD